MTDVTQDNPTDAQRLARDLRVLVDDTEALLRHAKLIETEWSFAKAEVRAFREGHAGQLRIGAGPFW